MNSHAVLLSVVALARSETKHLAGCFSSLRPLIEGLHAETLIVLDSRADAPTREAANKVAQRVIEHHFTDFPTQRNFALQQAAGRWVFFIDPDERCTPALAGEIRALLASAPDDAYRVPRRNIFFGREVRHTGWWPDYQIRLLRRSACRYSETRAVHELPLVSGTVGTLTQPLIHYNYDTWGQFARKQRAYAPLEARALYAQGRRASVRSLLGQPLREFKRRFVDYAGYRDGLLGLALSLAMSLYSADIYRRLLFLQRQKERGKT